MAHIPLLPIGSNKTSMPVIEFGTAVWPLSGSVIMKEAIIEAIKAGYRHFDTGAVYNSEGTLGEAIVQAIDLRLIKSREELFVTSKLWISDCHYEGVVPALQESLNCLKLYETVIPNLELVGRFSRRLCLEYLDLYLIHHPISLVGGGYDFPFVSDNLVPMDFKSVWAAMEECQILGLTKNIGVSNFSCQKLRNLISTAKIPPAVNRVEMSPLWRQTKLREFCEENGIHITAYSPLGARGTIWGTNDILDNEVLKEIAQLKGKTTAQVCLRWIYEQGVSFVVKSFNKERIKENISIFDWMLSPRDCELINEIAERRGNTEHFFITENGPYKSVQEFWDGEI